MTPAAVDQQFYRPFRALFLRMALFDSSARKLVLANAAIFCEQRWRSAREAFRVTPEAATYYLQSCRELSCRFADPSDRLSDGVIATVLGFLCHDVSQPRSVQHSFNPHLFLRTGQRIVLLFLADLDGQHMILARTDCL